MDRNRTVGEISVSFEAQIESNGNCNRYVRHVTVKMRTWYKGYHLQRLQFAEVRAGSKSFAFVLGMQNRIAGQQIRYAHIYYR